MKIETHKFFGRVKAFELGWSPVGRPMMAVHVFIAGRVVIDTGLSHMREAACRLAEENGIASVLLTHYHEDHAGNAAAIARRTGAPLYAHALTCEKMRRPAPIFPYQHLMWGAAEPAEISSLPTEFHHDGLRLLPVPTPGHSRDHTVFLEPDQGWLFSGDLYLGDRIKYFRADENIADQIRSIRTILAHDFDALFCAHRPVPEGGKKRLAAKLDFLENFYGRVAALAYEGMDVRTIMKRLALSETRFIKYLCFGNVSMANMVRSVIATRGQIVV